MTNKLIIFDFDGVLVDTELTTFRFYQDILPKYGINLIEDDFKYKVGRKSIDFFKDVLKEKFDQSLVDELVQLKRKAFINDIIKYLKPIPYAFEFLKVCEKEKLLMSIGTQNEYELIQKAVDVFDIRKYFKVITSLQDIKNKKPDPEVFLLVTSKLNVKPEESVVIEDSPDGIKAAITGGFKSIGITSSFKYDDLKKANKVIDSMKELTPDIIRSL